MSNAHHPLNRAYLADIFEAGGEALVQDVVGTFLEDAPRRMRALNDAVTAGDWPAVSQAAHGMVSGASMLGLTDVAESARQCEHTAGQGIRPAADALQRLHAAVAAASGVLREEIARLVAASESGSGGAA